MKANSKTFGMVIFRQKKLMFCKFFCQIYQNVSIRTCHLRNPFGQMLRCHIRSVALNLYYQIESRIQVAVNYGCRKIEVPLNNVIPLPKFEKTLKFDPMTLVLKLHLVIVKMYLHTKNEVSMSRHSKVIAHTDRHTHSIKTLLSAYAGGNDHS